MHNRFLKAGASFGGLAVLLGAFGAHALKQKLTPDALIVFETGVRYMMYHAFALLAVGILVPHFPGRALIWAGRCFIAGIILFSGSLFVLPFFLSSGITVPLALGLITPLGGLAFICGWIFMLRGFFGTRTDSDL